MNKPLLDDTLLSGANAAFIEAVYDEYLHNPNSVALAWREYFDRLAKQPEAVPIKQGQIPAGETPAAAGVKPAAIEAQTALSEVVG
ncbi:MAG: hypothetical protein JSR51_07490, partial [Proteobacteria bacterium]|nr:hypothetical protein [Pseudomonadota bacterium]